MSESVLKAGLSRKRMGRVALRVLNGAAIGTLLGGLLGFLLGGISAIIVGVGSPGGFNPNTGFVCLICAVYGVFPGVPAGTLIGATLALRSDLWRGVAALLLGLAAGLTYTWLLKDNLASAVEIRVAIIVSGLAGGVVMAWLMRGIRRRWSWWTRWEG